MHHFSILDLRSWLHPLCGDPFVGTVPFLPLGSEVRQGNSRASKQAERTMCNITATTSTTTNSNDSSVSAATNEADNDTKPDDDDDLSITSLPTYTLRDHCRYLRVKRETTSSRRKLSQRQRRQPQPQEQEQKQQHWYCDLTQEFVSNPTHCAKTELENVVVEYCQPFSDPKELQERVIGIPSLSPNQPHDPWPVRTLSIRLRPDVQQSVIVKSVEDAFGALHPKHSLVLPLPSNISNSDDNEYTQSSFIAIGADGHVPLLLRAHVASDKTTFERRLWVFLYHHDDFYLKEEELQRIGGISNRKPMLSEQHTRINSKLQHACKLVEYIVHNRLPPSEASPEANPETTSEFFRTRKSFSDSVKGVNQKQRERDQQTKEEGSQLLVNQDRERRIPTSSRIEARRADTMVFPSLAKEDYAVLQESMPLIERIFSELELSDATFNTLVGPHGSKRFGTVARPTLDRGYTIQLSRISQHYMVTETLPQAIQQMELSLQASRDELTQFETYLITEVLSKRYNLPLPNEVRNDPTATSSVVGCLGQTPVSLPRRDPNDFPWHPEVRKALEDISQQVTNWSLKDFDPTVSLTMASDAVDHVYAALDIADSADQANFLKRRNRQAMIQVTQHQQRIKRLLSVVTRAAQQGQQQIESNDPSTVSSQVVATIQKWNDIVQQSAPTSDTESRTTVVAQPILPLIEFKTKLGGNGCITPDSLILQSKPQVWSRKYELQCWKLSEIGVKNNWKRNPISPFQILCSNHKHNNNKNRETVVGCSPNTNVATLVQRIQVLQSLQ